MKKYNNYIDNNRNNHTMKSGEWIEKFSKKYKRSFWKNKITGEKTWYTPEENEMFEEREIIRSDEKKGEEEDDDIKREENEERKKGDDTTLNDRKGDTEYNTNNRRNDNGRDMENHEHRKDNKNIENHDNDNDDNNSDCLSDNYSELYVINNDPNLYDESNWEQLESRSVAEGEGKERGRS